MEIRRNYGIISGHYYSCALDVSTTRFLRMRCLRSQGAFLLTRGPTLALSGGRCCTAAQSPGSPVPVSPCQDRLHEKWPRTVKMDTFSQRTINLVWILNVHATRNFFHLTEISRSFKTKMAKMQRAARTPFPLLVKCFPDWAWADGAVEERLPNILVALLRK